MANTVTVAGIIGASLSEPHLVSSTRALSVVCLSVPYFTLNWNHFGIFFFFFFFFLKLKAPLNSGVKKHVQHVHMYGTTGSKK